MRLLARTRQRLARAGLQAPPAAPPRQIAEQVRRELGSSWADGARVLHDWLLRLEAQRYAPDSNASLAKLRREFNQLNWPPQPARSPQR